MNARKTVLDALVRWEKGKNMLDETLEVVSMRQQLAPRERRWAKDVAFGVVRNITLLDYSLDQLSSRPTEKLRPAVRCALRIGAYQILFMSHIPIPAAVNESVKLVKGTYGGLAPYVNGVLRSLVRQKHQLDLPSLVQDPIAHISVVYSHPPWLVTRWIDRYGVDDTINLCRANNQPAPVGVRVNTLKTTVESLRERLASEKILAESAPYAANFLIVQEQHQPLTTTKSFAAGAMYIQDQASALVAEALDPKPGEVVYDLCSAPGGKTTHMAELMNDTGQIIAVDRNLERLKRLQENQQRLGIKIIEPMQGNAADLPATLPLGDRVLVDAPCSGLGVLRRKPDIRWQRSLEDIHTLSSLQEQILRRAAALVKPGGYLLYSTCTLEPEENQHVVKRVLGNNPQFTAIPVLPQHFGHGVSGLQLAPHVHQTDGFSLALYRRSEKF